MEGHVADLGYNVYTRELQLALAFRSFLSAFASQRRDGGVYTLSPPRDISTRASPPAPSRPLQPARHLPPVPFANRPSSVSPTPGGESADLFKRRSRHKAAAGFVTAGEIRVARFPGSFASIFILRSLFPNTVHQYVCVCVCGNLFF